MRPAFLAAAILFAAAIFASARQPTRPPSFADALDAAWERLPQRANFAARQNTAAARNLAGAALVPNAPTANGAYVNDKLAGTSPPQRPPAPAPVR